LAGSKPPEGIDENQIAAAAGALLRKRSRTIARRHPELVVDERDFMQSMKDYAALHPGCHPDGSCADAAQFKRFLASRKPTSTAGILARFKSGVLRLFLPCKVSI
jgi:hypothetical protein